MNPISNRVTLAVRAAEHAQTVLVTAHPSARIGELLDWLQVDDTYGPWLLPLQTGLRFAMQNARTGEELLLDCRLAETSVADGDELVVVRIPMVSFRCVAA